MMIALVGCKVDGDKMMIRRKMIDGGRVKET
jgi:hypothetical protein